MDYSAFEGERHIWLIWSNRNEFNARKSKNHRDFYKFSSSVFVPGVVQLSSYSGGYG